MSRRPLIGVTCDVEGDASALSPRVAPSFGNYLRAVIAAGGDPVPIGAWRAVDAQGRLEKDAVARDARTFDGFVFTGGRDPEMSPFGVETHPVAQQKLMHPLRQAYETAMLEWLTAEKKSKPTLAICLGCQLMALAGGGTLDQNLPDSIGDAARVHGMGEDVIHEIKPIEGAWLAAGAVISQHHQAVGNAGPNLRVIARSPDGVIEAIDGGNEHFPLLGVQWHPERTSDYALGQGLFDWLIAKAAGREYVARS